MGVAGAAALGQAKAAELSPALPPAFSGGHKPQPLKFDPAKLTGLSEKLIQSHYDNNYIGSVRTLNMIEGRLAAAMADKDLPPVVYGGLKREELHRTGSVILHELYFGALGGNGMAAGDVRTALAGAFGSYEAWEAEFRRTAMALAGGSGWCVLAFNLHTNSLHNYWAWDHMHQPAASVPLLTLDMYEHAFHMDYGTAAAKYVDAFMANLDWEEVDRRFRKISVSMRVG
ncbi:MAG: Fe-Mn family superoxide dismutase [Novosphingobium sp.]|nr:Fe-Mn family superoxide dismutase [Novosphingobium sp.]